MKKYLIIFTERFPECYEGTRQYCKTVDTKAEVKEEIRKLKESPFTVSFIQLYHLRKIRESGGYGILLFPKDFEKFKGFNEHKSKSNAWYLSNIEEQKRWKIKLEEKEI